MPKSPNQGQGASIRFRDPHSEPETLIQSHRPSLGNRYPRLALDTLIQGKILDAYVIGPFGAAAPLTITYYQTLRGNGYR